MEDKSQGEWTAQRTRHEPGSHDVPARFTPVHRLTPRPRRKVSARNRVQFYCGRVIAPNVSTLTKRVT